MSRVQLIELGEDAEGQRLDRWFRRSFPHIGQGRIEKMCRKGEIRLDGGRVKASDRLHAGMSLRIPPLPDTDAPRPARPELGKADAAFVQSLVIWKDPHILALVKPPGLAMQGGTGQERHLDGLAEGLKFDLDDKPRLVHRLDKDTSGVVVMARTGRAAAALAKAFASRRTRKIYWAAVAGVPRPRAGTIRYGLVKQAGHGPHGAGERMICLHPDRVSATPGAKHAQSDYLTLATAAKRAAWVALSPITGRTHQLRAHMAEIGHPIVGDGKYGTNRQTNEGDGWGAQLGGEVSRKLHLHARSLGLTHPVTGQTLTLVAPLPDHMARTWDLFGWDSAEVPAGSLRGRGSPVTRALAIFDVDGTLIDSQEQIVAAMRSAFDRSGLAAPDRTRMLSVVGLSLTEAFEAWCPASRPRQGMPWRTTTSRPSSSVVMPAAGRRSQISFPARASCWTGWPAGPIWRWVLPPARRWPGFITWSRCMVLKACSPLPRPPIATRQSRIPQWCVPPWPRPAWRRRMR